MKETPIAFVRILILFIVLAINFTFCSSESLDKNSLCHHSITGLNAVYLI